MKRDRAKIFTDLKHKIVSENVFQAIEWEAGMKSFKTDLRKVSNAQKFTFEEFTTMLPRIEACLNSRPLCPMTDNPSDINLLNPGHCLMGSSILSPSEPDLSLKSFNCAKRWRKLKVLHHLFAYRWKLNTISATNGNIPNAISRLTILLLFDTICLEVSGNSVLSRAFM